MFSQSKIEAVESSSVMIHRSSGNDDSFETDFPSSMLNDAVAFAFNIAAQRKKSKKADASEEAAESEPTKIAVQLCDASLPHSVKLIHELESRTKQQQQNQQPIDYFILADSTFAPCCADQVTAQRNNADAILHFGQTCFSHSADSLPVAFFVPPWSLFASGSSPSSSAAVCRIADWKRQLSPAMDAATTATSSVACNADQLLSIVFVFAAGLPQSDLTEFRSRVAAEWPAASSDRLRFCQCGVPSSSSASTGGRNGEDGDDDSLWNIDGAMFPVQQNGRQVIFYVSPHGACDPLHQLTLVEYWNSAARMTKAHTEDNADDDDEKGKESASKSACVFDVPSWLVHLSVPAATSSLLSRSSAGGQQQQAAAARDVQRRINQRMRNIEALSRASSVGLLVLSLSMSEHRALLQKLQHMLRVGGKRVYVVFIGHLNEFKLANFADSIDLFVSLACPNSRPANFAKKEDNFNVPLLFPAEVSLWFERDVNKVKEEDVTEKFMSTEQYTTRATKMKLMPSVASGAAPAENAVNGDDEDDDNSTQPRKPKEQQHPPKEGVVLAVPKMHISTTRGGNGSGCGGEGTLQRFQQRSYQGLKPRLGEDKVQDRIIDGLSGIARGYETVKAAPRSDAQDDGKTRH